MATVVRFDQGGMDALLRSRNGPVARDLLKRGRRVESRAKVLCPVDRGRLRSSITHELVSIGGDLVVRIGTNVEYARAVHDGTGVYGPKGRPITPVTAKVLAWPNRGTTSKRKTRTGRTVTTRAQTATSTSFAAYVAGSPGRPFLARALPAAR